MEMSSQMQQYMKEKEEIEKELKKIKEQYEPYIQKDFDKGLIDSEGFPKPDLEWGELVEYKNLKRRNAELTNDYKDLMKKIETELYNIHSQAKQSGQADRELEQIKQKKQEQQKAQEEQQKKEIEQKKAEEQKQQEKTQQQFKNKIFAPFAQITEVTEGSPAFKAGIQVNDLVYDFGGVNSKNHCHLSALIFKVKENVGKQIIIKLIRENNNLEDQDSLIEWNNKKIYQVTELQLCPQKWEGQGVTGCRFKEI